MPRTIGSNLVHARAFLIERFGWSGWAKLLASLPPEDRPTLGVLSSEQWYEEGLLFRLLGAIQNVAGGGDLKLLEEFGRDDAERDMKGPQRLFFRLANPAYVLEKAGSYWSRFHDTGRWTVERHPHGATGTLSDFHVDGDAFCATLTGYIGRMFELVGAKGARAEHAQCRVRGDQACVFIVRWQ